MPTYTYRCSGCGVEFIKVMDFEEHDLFPSIEHWLHQPEVGVRPPACGVFQQVLSLNFHRSLPEHFNNSIGEYVSNSRDMSTALSRKSDEMSERMGFAVKYETVDPRDTPGVSEVGLEATERRAFDAPGAERPKKLIV